MRRVALAVALALPSLASAQTCVNLLNRQTYAGGFQPAHFSSQTDTQETNGALQLNTALMPLDTEHIVLPFDQDVRVKSVYFNAGATHTLGWMYLDQFIPTYYDPVNNKLVDANNDGIPDLYSALWIKSGNTTLLLANNKNYSDGGNYPHIPNLLEPTPVGSGNLIFKLMNDNGATGWTFNYNGVNLPPLQDGSAAVDGIVDYDVNGNGILAEEPDRTVDLGTIQGNREIVFFVITYWGQTGPNLSFAIAGNGTQDTGITPLFSKSVLNIDANSVGKNDTIRYTDLGARSWKDVGQCEKATAAGAPGGVPTPLPGQWVDCNGTPYPDPSTNNDATKQTSVRGFLNQTTIDRLNTPTYGNLVLPHEVRRVVAGPNGTLPHVFLGAPSTDPNRWILGIEDLLGYTVNSCANCTHSDFSFDDVVFLIERLNGGVAVSQNVSQEIPQNQLATTDISKIHIDYTASFPPPCTQPPDSRVDLYYSVDDGVTWHLVVFPANSPNSVTIDLLSLGIVGNALRWKAQFITPVNACQPQLNSLNIGYEAIQNGEYGFAEPLTSANVLVRGTEETPSPNWVVTGNDRSLRGHLRMSYLSDPATHVAKTGAIWDAGAALQSMSPDARTVYWNNAGVATAFNTGSAPLMQQVLPAAVRATLYNGKLLYDLNGDNVVDNLDAQVIVQWTRGWESAGVQRAWKLGGIGHSSPALVGPPPGEPWWLPLAKTPPAEKTAYTTFQQANVARPTIVLAGAADGMVHAFDAGDFRFGNDPTSAAATPNGYFLVTNNVRNYGTGNEVWGFVPTSQLGYLKNNLPAVSFYQPELNPRANVDGALTVDDVILNNVVHTLAIVGGGKTFPYLSALDITSTTAPKPMWSADWTDLAYNGSNFGASLAPSDTPGGRQFLVHTTSGLAAQPQDVYYYSIAAATGVTYAKVKLNQFGGTGGSKANGIAGSPALVDSDGDGMVDRAYVVDTNGRLFKVNTQSGSACLLAQSNETVFSPLAIDVSQGATPHVRVYFGGGSNPDVAAPNVVYHFWAYQDDDAPNACGAAKLLYSQALPAGQKVWAAPVVSGSDVFVGTGGSSTLDLCDPTPGDILGFQTSPDGNGNAVPLMPTIGLNAGEAVGGLRAFDGHLFVNTLNGSTTVIGGNTWNNPGSGAPASSVKLPTTVWYEP